MTIKMVVVIIKMMVVVIMRVLSMVVVMKKILDNVTKYAGNHDDGDDYHYEDSGNDLLFLFPVLPPSIPRTS